MTKPIKAKPRGAVEAKVKASTWTSLLVTLAGGALLAITSTDFVDAWPDWLEVVAYALIPAAATFLAGYQTKNGPDELSASSIAAVQQWLAKHAPRGSRPLG